MLYIPHRAITQKPHQIFRNPKLFAIMKHSPTAVEETLREAPVGKGLAASLKLLEERGALRGIDDYGGGKFAKNRKISVAHDDASKEIRIERRDEYGRIMTPNEAFLVLSHKFHGKGPGKRAQEKRKKLHEEESKSKQLQFNADKPSLFMGRMSELQA